MCDSCGCGDTKRVPVQIQTQILEDNDRMAAHLRAHFREAGVVSINLMGSPGSGKTALLEATASGVSSSLRLSAISGDLATDNDAQRLSAAGIPAKSITTGSACHLDAEMVHGALHDVGWRDVDYFFIENVGNLVCPAVYDLGQSANVVALSVTEGEDKPLKYPAMFLKADLVLLTKIDLLPHLPEVRPEVIEAGLAQVMPMPSMIPVSARTGAGVDRWVAWLAGRAARARSA